MPPATTRTNPTKLREKFDAGSIAVCRMGNKVALHISTPEGEILVHMREIDFVRGCRGLADHNGVPFRTVDEIDVEKRLAAEAAKLPPPEVKDPRVIPPGDRRRRPLLKPETLKLYEQIYAIDMGPHERGAIVAACRARGIRSSRYFGWKKNQLQKASA